MITEDEIIPLLLKASPTFKKDWEDYPDKELLNCALGEFARHLLRLYESGEIETLKSVGAAIEQLHLNGDANVREATTIGLLEGIQNVWGNHKVDPERFKPFLLATSLKWWDELNSFWNGERRYVGEGLTKELNVEEVAKIREEVKNRFKERS